MDGAELVRLILPLVLGALGAVVASSVNTPGRLRRDLQVESEMLTRLPPGPRREFRREIDRRGHLLVANVRFPNLTLIDLLVSFGILAMIVSSIRDRLGLAPLITVEAGPPPDKWWLWGTIVMVSVGILAAWCFMFTRWARRALNRLDYITTHATPPDAREAARHIDLGIHALQYFGAAGALCLILPEAVVQLGEPTPPETPAWILLLAVLATFTTMALIMKRTRLQKAVSEALQT